jgi:hypothetical protein
MDDLNSLLIKLGILSPPLQVRESQGHQNFHRFPELPIEIREMIWKFSFPDDCSIRVCPIILKDSDPPFLVNAQRVFVKFSYKDNNLIAAL